MKALEIILLMEYEFEHGDDQVRIRRRIPYDRDEQQQKDLQQKRRRRIASSQKYCSHFSVKKRGTS